MAEYELVRRKKDGRYVSVDGDFTLNRAKAFVFYEGAAMGISSYLTDEYKIVPLTDEEVRDFEYIISEWDNNPETNEEA